jgi:uncharacterized membrane protein
MTNLRISARILAPRAHIWATWLDVEHWPGWTSTVISAKRLEASPLSLGSRTLLRQPRLPAAIWQVIELDEAKGIFIWATRSPGVTVTASHQLEELPDGSVVTHALKYTGLLSPVIGRLYRSQSQEYLATEIQGLKAYCES